MTKHDTSREAGSPELSSSKDQYFERVAALANGMIQSHGKDFAMGTLLLAARFIAEGKPLSSMDNVEPPQAG